MVRHPVVTLVACAVGVLMAAGPAAAQFSGSMSGGFGGSGMSGMSGGFGSSASSMGQGFRPAAGSVGLNRPGGIAADPFGGSRASPLLSSGGYGFGGQQQFGGGFSGNQGQFGRGGRFSSLGGVVSTAGISRYSLQESFRPIPPPLGDIRTRLEGMLSTSSPAVVGRRIQLGLEGPTLVLSGVVASETEKQFLGAMVRLEPGVYQVQNDLRVKSLPPAEPEEERSRRPSAN